MASQRKEGNELMQPYETRFAAIFGPGYHAFAFWKARVALYAILQAIGLEGNEEVIVPGYTCVVVPNAVRFVRAKPIYADIVPGEYNLDPVSVKERITSRTRALLVQHTYGIPANMDSLGAIADRHGLELIEDCAHVLAGSSHQSRLLGSFGRAAFFSFQWSKPYTTGLGGMAVTSDRELAKRLEAIQATFDEPPLFPRIQLQFQYRLYRRFFQPSLYWYGQKCFHALGRLGIFVGSSNSTELAGEKPSDMRWRMSDFQQHAGLSQIDSLGGNSAHRQRLSKYYSETFRRHGWPVSDNLDSGAINLLRFPLQVADKTRILAQSRRARVEIGSWFETPLHPLPLTAHHLVDYRLGACPVAESTSTKVINLPLHERASRDEAERIAHFVLSHTSPA